MATAKKSLAGKHIVLTGAKESTVNLPPLLYSLGADVTFLPVIEFVPPVDQTLLDSALRHLDNFDWIAFTSQNAVQFFCNRLRHLNLGLLLVPGAPRIAALGDTTASAAQHEGLKVDFVDSNARSGTELVSAFSARAHRKRILLPQSDKAGDRVGRLLREAGAEVTSVVAYRTSVPESLNREGLSRIEDEGADVVFFASPSGFHNFAQVAGSELLNRLAAQSVFAAIGPTTAEAIRDAGFAVAIEADYPKSRDIADAICLHFASKDRAKIAK